MQGRLQKKEGQEENRLGFSIIGKIKIGKKNAKGYPESVDYFIPSGPYAEQFKGVYGEKPQKLTIAFPSPFPEVCCNHRIEGRDSKGNLAAVSDGLNHKLWDDATKSYLPATNEQLENAKTKGIYVTEGYGDSAKKVLMPVRNWVERLTLRFVLLDMKGIYAVWELSTNGVASSIPNIIDNFDKMAEKAGRNMNKVTFDLSVSFAKGQKPGSQSRYPVLSLVPNLSFESVLKLNEFKNSEKEYNKLLTDDNINYFLEEGGQEDLKALPEGQQMAADGQQTADKEQNPKPEAQTPKPETPKTEFSPEALKQWVRDGGKENNKKINASTMSNLVNALNAVTNNNPQKANYLLNYLTNTDNPRIVTEGEAIRIIQWINPIDDGSGGMVPEKAKLRVEQVEEILNQRVINS